MAKGRGSRRRGIRVRTTVGATVVVGLALVVVAVALIVAMRSALTDEVRSAAQRRADEVAAAIRRGTPPGDLDLADPEDQLVQVIGDDGAVLAATPVLRGAPPLGAVRPGATATLEPPTDDGKYLAVAADADTGGVSATVIAARDLSDVFEPTDVLTRLLAIALLPLLALVAATCWLVTGRALAPVEAITSEVDAIGSGGLHRRVPTPGTGDEIGHLASTMNRMLDRLEHGQAEQRRFVSDASHELRSPLAAIRQHVEVALAHPSLATTDQLAGRVHPELLRLQGLVDGLLLLAHADEGGLSLRDEPVDLDDIVLAEAARLRQSTSLTVDLGGVSGGQAYGDAVHLARLVRNLADNAASYASARIAFGVAEEDGGVVLLVDDDGPGIRPAERARALDRFVRLDEARSRDRGGSGLGLAIVAEIARAHGGAVTIEASPLGGARVRVTLCSGCGQARGRTIREEPNGR